MRGQVQRVFAIKVNRLLALVCGVLSIVFLVGSMAMVAFTGYPSFIIGIAVAFALSASLLVGAYVVLISRPYFRDICRAPTRSDALSAKATAMPMMNEG